MLKQQKLCRVLCIVCVITFLFSSLLGSSLSVPRLLEASWAEMSRYGYSSFESFAGKKRVLGISLPEFSWRSWAPREHETVWEMFECYVLRPPFFKALYLKISSGEDTELQTPYAIWYYRRNILDELLNYTDAFGVEVFLIPTYNFTRSNATLWDGNLVKQGSHVGDFYYTYRLLNDFSVRHASLKGIMIWSEWSKAPANETNTLEKLHELKRIANNTFGVPYVGMYYCGSNYFGDLFFGNCSKYFYTMHQSTYDGYPSRQNAIVDYNQFHQYVQPNQGFIGFGSGIWVIESSWNKGAAEKALGEFYNRANETKYNHFFFQGMMDALNHNWTLRNEIYDILRSNTTYINNYDTFGTYTPEGEVKILNGKGIAVSEVQWQESAEKLSFNAESTGTKTIYIYAGNRGSPNNVKVQGASVTFSYNSTKKLLSFNVTFSSSKHIDIIWGTEMTPPPSTSVPPVASFTYSPSEPTVNETVTFNASESYDPDGWIVSYTWNLDENVTVITTNTVINYTYKTAKDFNVTLTITDNNNVTSSAWSTVKVLPPPSEPSPEPLPSKASVTIGVRDFTTDTPISGASIRIKNETWTSKNKYTNVSGWVDFSNLTLGNYTLIGSAEEYATTVEAFSITKNITYTFELSRYPSSTLKTNLPEFDSVLIATSLGAIAYLAIQRKFNKKKQNINQRLRLKLNR